MLLQHLGVSGNLLSGPVQVGCYLGSVKIRPVLAITIYCSSCDRHLMSIAYIINRIQAGSGPVTVYDPNP